MRSSKRSLILGVAGAGLLCAGAAFAQATNTIGPPQLRDFQLRPREQAGPPSPQGPRDPQNPQNPQNPQPRAPQPRPVQVAPPPPATSGQPAAQPAPGQPQRTTPAPTGTQRAPAQPGSTPTQSAPAPTQTPPQPTGEQAPVTGPVAAPPAIEPVAEPATPSDGTPPAPEGSGTPIWLYGLPALLLVLGGLFLWQRRRARSAELAEAAEVAVAPPSSAPAPAAPRPDPSPRPWLELDVKTVRASFTAEEAVIEFELTIANIGGAAARNLKIDVKMFNAGTEQDQQIGTFFRTAGRETTRLVLPGIEKEQDGVINGEVGMPLDEMKAVKLDGRMLFIPVLAVNVLYEWGEGRSGQSAKSYVIGRELENAGEKMGAFRVDQGPRVWRTVGQRQHKLARRV